MVRRGGVGFTGKGSVVAGMICGRRGGCGMRIGFVGW